MLGESIKIMLPTATGLVKQISFGGLGRRKCQSIRKAFPYVKGALSSLKKWISRQYLHLVQAENICLKSALEGKSYVSLISGEVLFLPKPCPLPGQSNAFTKCGEHPPKALITSE